MGSPTGQFEELLCTEYVSPSTTSFPIQTERWDTDEDRSGAASRTLSNRINQLDIVELFERSYVAYFN